MTTIYEVSDEQDLTLSLPITNRIVEPQDFKVLKRVSFPQILFPNQADIELGCQLSEIMITALRQRRRCKLHGGRWKGLGGASGSVYAPKRCP